MFFSNLSVKKVAIKATSASLPHPAFPPQCQSVQWQSNLARFDHKQSASATSSSSSTAEMKCFQYPFSRKSVQSIAAFHLDSPSFCCSFNNKKKENIPWLESVLATLPGQPQLCSGKHINRDCESHYGERSLVWYFFVRNWSNWKVSNYRGPTVLVKNRGKMKNGMWKGRQNDCCTFLVRCLC